MFSFVENQIIILPIKKKQINLKLMKNFDILHKLWSLASGSSIAEANFWGLTFPCSSN